MNEINSPWRSDFPFFTEHHSKPRVYLDTAASAQKPQVAIDQLSDFYRYKYATVHRGVHYLSAHATENLEKVRQNTASYINAATPQSIIFTKGATESINLVAYTFCQHMCNRNSEVIITEMEHHANIIPWQLAAQRIGFNLKIWPLEDDGTLSLDTLKTVVSEKTKLIAFTHMSNVLGTINPIKTICQWARSLNIATLVDGAQGIVHTSINVEQIGCDFYAFSAHKLYGPSGVGVLYMSPQWQDVLPPWQAGGAMVQDVDLFTGSTYLSSPAKFEAGTPNMAGIIGFGSTLNYLNAIGLSTIHDYETALFNYALTSLQSVSDIQLFIPQTGSHGGLISFNLGQHHAFDVGSFLDKYGIAIRTGHHCAMPLLKKHRIPAICRASFGLYNQTSDIDALVSSLKRINHLLN